MSKVTVPLKRVVFMGTPDFAVPVLEALVEAGYQLAGVFTQPDRPKGRSGKPAFSPVKEAALAHGIPVFQPEKIRKAENAQLLRQLEPDVIVVAAFGQIIPKEILELPPYGCVNVHASLLPKYRGAAPIQWAVLNGDKITGVSTMYLAHDMDAGDIIYTNETPIGEFETSGELFDRLMEMGAELLVKTIRDIEAGIAPRRPQDPEKASYVKMLDKSLCPIDWNKSPRAIVKQICGLQPWPVATMDLEGKSYKVYSASYTENKTGKAPGSIVSAGVDGIEIACAGGETLRITELQAPGKKRMPAADFLRGHPLKPEP